MTTDALPDSYDDDRTAVQRIATHVLSRARHAVVGRIDLTATPGGLGTPAFGDEHTVVRLTADSLVVERTGEAGATTRSMWLEGSSLADLARFAGADLRAEYSAGHDTPPVGEVDEPIHIASGVPATIGAWFALGAAAIDAIVVAAPPAATPGRARIWPEHLDLGIDLAAGSGARLNLGASVGDGFHGAPYLYVGPWVPDRPGDAAYWNAPFGAVLGFDDVRSGADPVAFFREGVARFG